MRWPYILIIFILGTVSCLQVGKAQYAPKPPAAPKVEAKPYEYQDKPPKGAYIQPLHPKNPFDIKGDDVDKGGEVTKACRYDDPPWSDCDPFELIRYRTLRLVAGGRQCEEAKNMTKKCTPYELPAGIFSVSISLQSV